MVVGGYDRGGVPDRRLCLGWRLRRLLQTLQTSADSAALQSDPSADISRSMIHPLILLASRIRIIPGSTWSGVINV